MFASFVAANDAASIADVYGAPPTASAADIFELLDTSVRFQAGPPDANVVIDIDDDLEVDIKLLEDVKTSIASKLHETHAELRRTHDILEDYEKIHQKAREFFQLKHDAGDELYEALVDNARIYNVNVVQKHQELREDYATQCARAHVLLDRLRMTRLDDDFTCCICMENKVDTVIVPCGHTLCSMCMARTSLGLRSCHRCKRPVETSMHLFF